MSIRVALMKNDMRNLLVAISAFSVLAVGGAFGEEARQPVFSDPRLSSGVEYRLVFDSDFSNPAVLDAESKAGLWRHEDMASSGNSSQHRQSKGRRHAAWYDRYRDQTAFIRDGVLVQRGFVADSDQPDFVSRDAGDADRNHAYVDPDPSDAEGGEVNFADFELHTSWIDTFAVKEMNGERVPVQRDDVLVSKRELRGREGFADTRSPNITFRPGTYFEIEVNFEGMEALSHRHSFWLMPATADRVAYDGDPGNGLEIDIYEHELSVRREGAVTLENDHQKNEFMLMKCIGGSTNPPTTFNELRDDGETLVQSPGINRGWHRVGLLWTRDRLTWLIDGVAVVQDSKLVPQVPMYLIVSREANTGASRGGGSTVLKADGDKIPRDAGLLGRNVATPENRDLIKAGRDEVLVRSVRAWQITQ